MTPAELKEYLDQLKKLNVSSILFIILSLGAFAVLMVIMLTAQTFNEQHIIIIGLCVTIITAALSFVQNDIKSKQINATVTETHAMVKTAIFCNKPNDVKCQYANDENFSKP